MPPRRRGPRPARAGQARPQQAHQHAKIIARLGRRAGLAYLLTPHGLRHAFITLDLDAGASLRDVQDAAGHADPRTTRCHARRALLAPSRRILQPPVASPVVLGWLAWACTAFVIAAELAWGYGGPGALTALGSYTAFMGLAQLLAASRGYNARDTLVTGFHGVWGATWLGVAILMAFIAPNQLPQVAQGTL